ncbi:MAG: response regulator [Flavobacteriales bacterium]|nr:response regulator [Flavobacteriales bacterium]
MTSAIIVDDIEDSRINLRADIADYCADVEVIGEAESVVSALRLIKEKPPQIVFLDIHLGDGTGFDILELLPSIDFKVIFTTASDAFAIKAFKYSAIDYLLKPIDPDELVKAVKSAVGQYRLEHPQVELLMENLTKKSPISKLALSTLEKIHVVEIKSIVRC